MIEKVSQNNIGRLGGAVGDVFEASWPILTSIFVSYGHFRGYFWYFWTPRTDRQYVRNIFLENYQNYKTTRLQHYKTTRLQNYKTEDNKTTRLQNCKTTKLPHHQTTRYSKL